jgi:hypothetical protein
MMKQLIHEDRDFLLPDLLDLASSLDPQIIFGMAFVRCNFVEPLNLFLTGRTGLKDSKIQNVDFVLVRDGIRVVNVVAFVDCHFEGCTFDRVTFFVAEGDRAKFEAGFNRPIPWLNAAPAAVH